MTTSGDEPIDVDAAAVERFWLRCVAAAVVGADEPVPAEITWFGDHAAMADELAGLVVAGTKRATVSALADYEHDQEPLPQIGRLWIVVDGGGRPRALARTTDVRVGPLSSVDDQFAWDEGEGDRTRQTWLRDHEAFFRRFLPTIGARFSDDMPTVFERFETLFTDRSEM